MQSCETQRKDWLKYKVIVEIHCASDGRSDWQKTINLRFKVSAVSSRRGHFLSSGDRSFWHKVKKKHHSTFFKGEVKGDWCFPSSNLYFFSGCYKDLRQCCPRFIVRHLFFCWAGSYCIVVPSIYPWVNIQVYWHVCSTPFCYLPWKTTVAVCTDGILQCFPGISPSAVTLLSLKPPFLQHHQDHQSLFFL